jgi:2-polyprenyl-3-methyl-5-hydroxy-6-metoxy-1,4-benzoquinol methylase
MTPSAIARLARSLYRDAPLLHRWVQMGRPHICPFEVLFQHVPPGADVLDIGSGAGLFLGLLASENRITEGVGLDACEASITTARAMAERVVEMGFPGRLRFEQSGRGLPWPAERFDVVSLVDVIHHVPPSQQTEMFRKAVSKLRPGGRLIYKDISARPRWRMWANQLHDLLVARQWVHVAPIHRVEEWARAQHLKAVHSAYIPRLWYGHDLRVWSSPQT